MIERGDTPEEPWKAEVRCHTCSALLEIEPKDILTKDTRSREKDRTLTRTGYYVACPLCFVEILLEDLPAHVIRKVLRSMSEWR